MAKCIFNTYLGRCKRVRAPLARIFPHRCRASLHSHSIVLSLLSHIVNVGQIIHYHQSSTRFSRTMSWSGVSRIYYFDTDSFIDIVHDLEELPETGPQPRSRNDSIVENITPTDLERWRKVFGVAAPEARYMIAQTRGRERPPPSAEALQAWP